MRFKSKSLRISTFGQKKRNAGCVLLVVTFPVCVRGTEPPYLTTGICCLQWDGRSSKAETRVKNPTIGNIFFTARDCVCCFAKSGLYFYWYILKSIGLKSCRLRFQKFAERFSSRWGELEPSGSIYLLFWQSRFEWIRDNFGSKNDRYWRHVLHNRKFQFATCE